MSWQPVIRARRLSRVLDSSAGEGYEEVLWRCWLACGTPTDPHVVDVSVRYADADGPENKGPHLPPAVAQCRHGCIPAQRPAQEQDPWWTWAVLYGLVLAAIAAVVAAGIQHVMQ